MEESVLKEEHLEESPLCLTSGVEIPSGVEAHFSEKVPSCVEVPSRVEDPSGVEAPSSEEALSCVRVPSSVELAVEVKQENDVKEEERWARTHEADCWNGIKQFPRTLPLLSRNKSQTCARPQVLRKKIQHAMQTTD